MWWTWSKLATPYESTYNLFQGLRHRALSLVAAECALFFDPADEKELRIDPKSVEVGRI